MSLVDDISVKIREALNVLRNTIHRTPLTRSMTFSRITGGEVYLKMENLQKTGAFKVRGAYYKLWKLTQQGYNSCITASSGNHAQGVAYSASMLGSKATIFMPRYTPFYKVEATKSYGAEVILYGEIYDEAYSKAYEVSKKRGVPFIHPFDDTDIIAGQGTIGVEIYEDLEDVDIVIVPVGGGGLISGIAIALKKLKPSVKVIGVQPKGAPSTYLSYYEGKIVETPHVFTIADGVIVKKPGELTFKIIKELVDDMVIVDDREIAKAVFLLLERVKVVAEPAGALGVAAILSGKVDIGNKKSVILISGGNVDLSLLSRIIEKSLYLEGRQVKIRGMLLDRPGQLKKVVDVIAEYGLNIVSIDHERGNPLVNPGMAEVTLGLEIPNREIIDRVLIKLKELGLDFQLIQTGE